METEKIEIKKSITPLFMEQLLKIKSENLDAMILLRSGDFYETYSTDAIVASEILGISLTKMAYGKDETTEIAYLPHSEINTYLSKLIRSGIRVAICDQFNEHIKSNNNSNL